MCKLGLKSLKTIYSINTQIVQYDLTFINFDLLINIIIFTMNNKKRLIKRSELGIKIKPTRRPEPSLGTGASNIRGTIRSANNGQKFKKNRN